jgi:hypothetical protein
MTKSKLLHKLKLRFRRKAQPQTNEMTVAMEEKPGVFARIMSLPRAYHIVLIVLLFAITFGGLYLADNFQPVLAFFRGVEPIDASYALLSKANHEYASSWLPAPSIVRDQVNPLDGELITKAEYETLQQRSVVAVTVNNHVDARPQHGLREADTVLEVLAEGGITRYVAVFYGDADVGKIGPVRSLRYYMIEFASGYDEAVIKHHGWAGFDNASWERYNEKTDARGAVRKWNIKSLQTAGSEYRDMAKAAKSGYVHALYTDSAKIYKEIAKKTSWKIGSSKLEPLVFKFDELPENRGEFNSVEIHYSGESGNAYAPSFVYDKESNTYKRFIAGKEDIDLGEGVQIAPKNVILEWHEYRPGNDGHARIVIDMIGEGPVEILNDGKRTTGTWKKTDRLARTHYFDANGAEIPLVRGQIWIAALIKTGDKEISKVTYK